MNDSDKTKLDHIIKTLRDHIRQPGAYVKESKKEVKSGDEKELEQGILALQVIIASQDAAELAMIKLMQGTGLLTPSLTTRGWKFWKQPSLGQKKRKLDNIVLGWMEDKNARTERFTKEFEIKPGDLGNLIIYLSSVMDIASVCNSQFLAKLNPIVGE